jgi:hypothetical protein
MACTSFAAAPSAAAGGQGQVAGRFRPGAGHGEDACVMVEPGDLGFLGRPIRVPETEVAVLAAGQNQFFAVFENGADSHAGHFLLMAGQHGGIRRRPRRLDDDRHSLGENLRVLPVG